MASSGSGYDLSSSTFSPDGRIFQVEYATKAVEHAGLCMGIKCSDGVVTCVQKPLQQKLLVEGSGQRIYTVASNCGMSITGFQPDARQLVHRARDEAASWVEQYGSTIPPQVLAERVASYIHYFTLHGSLRPFGAVGCMSGYDEEREQFVLLQCEPSGQVHSYKACAAGKGKQPAKTELEKLELHKTQLTCQEAIRQLVKIVHMLHDQGKDKPFELELGWISAETNYKHQGVAKNVIEEATKWAKEQLAEEEDDEEEEEEEGMEE